MSEPEKVRRQLELLAGITPRYTLNVTGSTISLVARSGVISSTRRYLYGENRMKTIETIEKIIDDGIQLLQREIFVLHLLKRAKEGIDNLKKTYPHDDEINKRLDNCLLRIENVCTRFEKRLIHCIEQIPLVLEELTPNGLTMESAGRVIQSHGQTPDKTPEQRSHIQTPLRSQITTPPSSPRHHSNLVTGELISITSSGAELTSDPNEWKNDPAGILQRLNIELELSNMDQSIELPTQSVLLHPNENMEYQNGSPNQEKSTGISLTVMPENLLPSIFLRNVISPEQWVRRTVAPSIGYPISMTNFPLTNTTLSSNNTLSSNISRPKYFPSSFAPKGVSNFPEIKTLPCHVDVSVD